MNTEFSLVLGSNIWTHHQVPLAKAIVSLMGTERFTYAVFDRVDEERRMMGWEDRQNISWVSGPPADEQRRRELIERCIDADVMIWGSCPEEILRARAARGGLTFVQSERMLKKPFHTLRMLNPRYAKGMRHFKSLTNPSHIHALAIGYHAPGDLLRLGAFGRRIWNWGYFVEVGAVPPAPVGDRPLRILWAGRMLDWKRVDVLLRAVARIQHMPWFGECTMIGDGPMRAQLSEMMRTLRLDPEKVRLEHSLPFAQVRARMRQSDLYVIPSNRHEGWGAVVGEAMAEGCIVIANEEAGASRVLITPGGTGFLFPDGDVRRLASVIEHAANQYELRVRVRRAAWERMHRLWNPRIGAERILGLASGLLGLSPMPEYERGPCAPCIRPADTAQTADTPTEALDATRDPLIIHRSA
ncbi:MAG TPA: glycosyltransferase [Bacteroidota bacterium]|nr:glycosyltransferase [Bacteroidota bacterium]